MRKADPEVPVTVTLYDPGDVDIGASTVMIVVQVAVQDEGVKKALAPDGRPTAENETDSAEPDTMLAVIGLVMAKPWTTV